MSITSFNGILPRIDPTAFVHPDAIIIGDVHIGPESSIWPGVVIRGDVNFIRIGTRTNVQDGSILHVARVTTERPEGFPLILGDNITIGHNVVLHGCRVESGSMIAIGAIVLDGSVVGAGALLGAGSLATPGSKIGPGELWIGSPARLLRPLTEKERLGLEDTNKSYAKLAKQYQLMESSNDP
ncbi:MAG: gamma carbonic anhydrase family protein [Magnetococcus sp. DMHC-6]